MEWLIAADFKLNDGSSPKTVSTQHEYGISTAILDANLEVSEMTMNRTSI